MSTLSTQLMQERHDGMSEADIAKKHNLTTVEVRALVAIARREHHMSLSHRIRQLAEQKHYSNAQIGQELGLTESEVRILLKGE